MNDKELHQLTYKMFANIMNWFRSEEEAEVVTIDLEDFKNEHDDDVFKIVAAITLSSEMAICSIAELTKKDFIDIHNLMNKVLFQVLQKEKTQITEYDNEYGN